MCYQALIISIQHQIVNTPEVNAPTHPPQMGVGAPLQMHAGECPHPLKMCYQALKRKTNSPWKAW